MNALILLAAAAGSPALEPVVVTATRTESPAGEVLASVDLIRRDDLVRMPAADLGDALRFVPGVEVARLGGPGQQTSLFLRGTESNHVLVLVDGLRINPGTIGTAAIQNVAPEFVERVEIVKGPRSTLYGSDAIGGVINIITRRGADAGRQRAGGLRRLRHDAARASPPASATSARRPRSRPPGSTARASRPAAATTPIAATRTPRSTRTPAPASARSTSRSPPGTPPAPRSTRISSSRPSTRTSRTRRSRSPRISRRRRPGRRSSPSRTRSTTSSRTSPRTSSTRSATPSTGRTTSRVADAHTVTAGVLWQDEEADAESFGAPYAARHDDEPVLPPGPG